MIDKPTKALGAKIVILLSGGLDSTTLLYRAKNEGFSVHAIAFDYGQKHIRELAAAGNVAKACPADSFTLINLTSVHDAFLNRAESSQTNPDFAVPHGHYADDNMKITIVLSVSSSRSSAASTSPTARSIASTIPAYTA